MENMNETQSEHSIQTNKSQISVGKDVLVSIVREWVKNDNELRELKIQENIRKKANVVLTEKLMTIMRTNSLDCFDINDGKIMYKKTNTKKAFSKKNILQLLNEFYKNDVEKANEVSSFLLENREEVMKEKIVRKINVKDS
jgi:hypothetical protein